MFRLVNIAAENDKFGKTKRYAQFIYLDCNMMCSTSVEWNKFLIVLMWR